MDPLSAFEEIFQQIVDLGGAGLDLLRQVAGGGGGGEGAPTEGGAPPAPPAPAQ